MKALWDRLVDVRDRTFLNLFISDVGAPSEEEIAYFSKHPDEIDEMVSPVAIHRAFLIIAVLVGGLIVGGSKILGQFTDPDYFDGVLKSFVVDVVFEVGVALIGAGVTAYFLGVLLNRQQQRTALWRKRLRAAIERQTNQSGKTDSGPADGAAGA